MNRNRTIPCPIIQEEDEHPHRVISKIDFMRP
jgi:hypothetical protein